MGIPDGVEWLVISHTAVAVGFYFLGKRRVRRALERAELLRLRAEDQKRRAG